MYTLESWWRAWPMLIGSRRSSLRRRWRRAVKPSPTASSRPSSWLRTTVCRWLPAAWCRQPGPERTRGRREHISPPRQGQEPRCAGSAAHRVGRHADAGAGAHPRAVRARRSRCKGVRMAACLHVTTETANLCARSRPAAPTSCSAPPTRFRTQDDVAAALVKDYGIPTFAIKGEDNKTYYQHINAALDHRPQHHHGRRRRPRRRRCTPSAPTCSPDIIGGTEETTTGVIRLQAHGGRRRAEVSRSSPSTTPTPSTCSTTATAPARARSTASSAPPTCCWPAARSSSWPATAGAAAAWPCAPRAWAPTSIVTEVDPLQRARGGDGRLPGHADGRGRARSATSSSPSPATSTSSQASTSRLMKDGAIVCNSGHFNVEIDIPALAKLAKSSAHDPRVRRGVHAAPTAAGSTCWARAG